MLWKLNFLDSDFQDTLFEKMNDFQYMQKLKILVIFSIFLIVDFFGQFDPLCYYLII